MQLLRVLPMRQVIGLLRMPIVVARLLEMERRARGLEGLIERGYFAVAFAAHLLGCDGVSQF